MDVGFASAGFQILWANDFDKDACKTYAANHSSKIECGDINSFLPALEKFRGVDVLFGGPPCQGFSVAGKMDPADERSQLLWSFVKAVKVLQPKAFVCENVKALAVLEKWSDVRDLFIKRVGEMGYDCKFIVLHAANYGVPQARERVFFIGLRNKSVPNLVDLLKPFRKKAKTIRETIQSLGPAGNPKNARICKAKITIAENPVLRKSPYAGMLFNGQGRPINLDGLSNTLPASMGGNKTPFVDEECLYNGSAPWVEQYHAKVMKGAKASLGLAPQRLRRLTIDEAIRIQTFPIDYNFQGPNSAIWRQIGNAVPPKLAEAVAKGVMSILDGSAKLNYMDDSGQREIDFRQ